MHRIEVAFREGIRDPQAERVEELARALGIAAGVRSVTVYAINAELSGAQLTRIAEELLADKVTQRYSVDAPLSAAYDILVERGYLPGVTDNLGRTAGRQVGLLFSELPVHSSTQFLLKGASVADAQRLAGRLANPLVERVTIVSAEEVRRKGGSGHPTPLVWHHSEPTVEQFSLRQMDSGELLALSRVRHLALSLEEMRAIQRHFPRDVSDVELECIAQTWSEHCKHKEFNALVHYVDIPSGRTETISGLFPTYIKGATAEIEKRLTALGKNYLVTVFHDNAGIVRFDAQRDFAFKVETHNSPSALDPYGGALTGILGVNRDPAGTGRLGADLLFNTDVFCFGDPFSREIPPETLHPMRILEGVHRGVRDGGNQSGIPTVNGSLVFDARFMGKPLVFCGTGGFMPSSVLGNETSRKRIVSGCVILMAGGRVGKDGIHGATLSSEERTASTPATMVQIGDAFTQKVMLDMVRELREKDALAGITDIGGGGLSSAVGEMARLSNGATVDLAKVPLKYPGLQPWEILVSESQERMLLACTPEHLEQIQDIAAERQVELTVLGEFTDSGLLEVFFSSALVGSVSIAFLHDGLPLKRIEAIWTPAALPEPSVPEPGSLLAELSRVLSRLNVCSKESIVRQYDHEVKGRSVVKPLTGARDDGPSDAAVMLASLDGNAGLAIGHGICPRYSDIDPYHMACNAFDEMVRNIVCVGGRVPDLDAGDAVVWSVNDNFCCPDSLYSEKNPEGKSKFAAVVRACKGLHDAAVAYGIPLTSGKDSMKNDFVHEGTRISIPLTLLCSGAAKLDDVSAAVTMDVKRSGDAVYVLGMTRRELGASEYYAMRGVPGGRVPEVRFADAKMLYRRLNSAFQLVESCHDCSDGGLGVALAESAFSGGLGMEVDLAKIPRDEELRDDELLFSESASRFVVTVALEHCAAFEQAMAGLPFGRVGSVMQEQSFSVTALNGHVEELPLPSLKESWLSTLRGVP